MFYKFHHGLVSINSSYQSKSLSSRLSLRENNDCRYDIVSCRTQFRQLFIFPRTIPYWKGLAQELVVVNTLECFKSGFISRLKNQPNPTLSSTTPLHADLLPVPAPHPHWSLYLTLQCSKLPHLMSRSSAY